MYSAKQCFGRIGNYSVSQDQILWKPSTLAGEDSRFSHQLKRYSAIRSALENRSCTSDDDICLSSFRVCLCLALRAIVTMSRRRSRDRNFHHGWIGTKIRNPQREHVAGARRNAGARRHPYSDLRRAAETTQLRRNETNHHAACDLARLSWKSDLLPRNKFVRKCLGA